MDRLAQLIEETTDVRELKRAVSVKLGEAGMATKAIGAVLQVTPRAVRKWRRRYEREGVDGLEVRNRGSESYLSVGQRQEFEDWLGARETITLEEVRDKLEARYGIVYQSKQSYYDFLDASGLSYHRTEKSNPKRNEAQVLARREEIQQKLAPQWGAIERGEVIVLLEDECHLVWGDVCGMVWGKRNAAIEVPITNERERQTYYGALNLHTREFHLSEAPAGNGGHTVAYLQWCQTLYPDKKLLLLWDGASYHRGAEMRKFLATTNDGLAEADWQVTCMRFAPNAPEQNPTEDVWLKGKTHLRKQFALNKTFAQVKRCFSSFLNALQFTSTKLGWYRPTEQMI